MNGFIVNHPKGAETYKCWERKPLDPTKIDWRSENHTNFTMKKVGVFPDGTTQADVLKEIGAGTFGGRFERFGSGHFTYVAYTD